MQDKDEDSKLNFYISVQKRVSAFSFHLQYVSLFSDVKKPFFPQDTNSRQRVWAPKEAKEKRSILKSEPFVRAKTGHG